MAKWTRNRLANEIEGYFAGISRESTVKEQVNTGLKDADGHWIYEEREALNGNGEVVTVTEWLLPPSVQDLQSALGITPEEWAEMKNDTKLSAPARCAEQTVERYLRRELLTRPNKAIKGVLVTLQKDFGFDEATEDSSSGTLEELLGGGGA